MGTFTHLLLNVLFLLSSLTERRVMCDYYDLLSLCVFIFVSIVYITAFSIWIEMSVSKDIWKECLDLTTWPYGWLWIDGWMDYGW